MNKHVPTLIPELAPAKPALAQDGTRLRVAFWTLGCRLNQYDTEGIRVQLEAARPIRVVPWTDEADLYILNSCTVTGKADQECRRLARQAKRRSPAAKVLVAGCYAQTQPESLRGVPEIDAVIGNTAKGNVAQWLEAVLASDSPSVLVEAFAEHPVFDSPLIDDFSGRSRAFVKIQDGCDLRCTYCLIWQARGPGRSRTVADIMLQLHTLVDSGFRETILAGIHLGGYGRDLQDGWSLPKLLRHVLEEFPALRIRLSSIHPNEVRPELLELFSQFPHLQPHLHISLQSGSDSVLARMKRPYRGRRAWEALQEIAALRPDFGIGADIIVGFPGETDQEFEDTRAMIEELPFSYLHVFRFSARPGTPAAAMPLQVHPETITARASSLRALARQKHEAFLESMIGHPREAILEAEGDLPGFRRATTDNYAVVLVPDLGTAGEVVLVEPRRREGNRLFAGIVEVARG